MLIIRKSPFTNKTNAREINITHDQLVRWQNGELIQNVMPNISPDDREFIMTGITPEEWNATFKDE